MVAAGDARAPRVVPTEFGALVLAVRDADDRMVASHERRGAPGRCWRCDGVACTALDRLGLCEACGQRLRAPPGD